MSLGLGLSKRLASKAQVFHNGLPPDGSTDKIGLAPRWPLVPVLPTPVVNGARYCVGASYDVAVEYLGRSVVRLSTITDNSATMPLIDAGITITDWEISMSYMDENATPPSSATPLLGILNSTLDAQLFFGVYGANNYLFLGIKNNGVFVVDLISTTSYSYGEFSDLSFGLSDGKVFVAKNGVKEYFGTPASYGWTAGEVSHVRLINAVPTESPHYICCYTYKNNGTLIDNIPCDESTGTELRNTAQPTRPALLTDVNAHALAWVPQASKTYGVFIWNGSAWVIA